MARLIALAVFAAAATTAAAEEYPILLNNIYPLTQEDIFLGDHIFHIADNTGGYEVVEGPMENGPVRCVGSGFGYQDGTSTIEGICIYGEGEDVFILRWAAGEKGAANDWEIVHGTGRWEGMTGSGIASTDIVSAYQAMPLRRTRLRGTIVLPD